MMQDEELIPALNEQDYQWIRDRDQRPVETAGGVFGQETPPAVRERNFVLHGPPISEPSDARAGNEHDCERDGVGRARDTLMEQDSADAETVPAVLHPDRLINPEPSRLGPAPCTPDKAPDFKKARKGVHDQDPPRFGTKGPGGGSRSVSLVPPLFAAEMQTGKRGEGKGPSLYDLTRGDSEPPWVAELQQGVRDMLDQQHNMRSDLQGFASTLRQHDDRISTLTRAHQDNALLHENTQKRLKTLETEVAELKRTSSRSPTPAPSLRGGYGPDRSPPSTPRGRVSIAEELSVVLGGWKDERKPEIEQEVRSMLQSHGVDFADIVVPYARSTFCRVQLVIDPTIHFADSRRAQQDVITKLKGAGLESRLPGSVGKKLWVAAHRTPEERARVRAVVSVTVFCEELVSDMVAPLPVDKEWRGRVFLGAHLVLGHHATRAKQNGDVDLMDTRGNATGWFLVADAFRRAVGIPVADLEERWLRHLEGIGR